MRKFILNRTTYSDVQKHTRLTFILQLCRFFPYFFSVSLDFEIKWSTINGVKYNWWSSPPESRPVFTVGTWNQSAGKVWDAPDLPARGQVWYNCINNQNQPFFHLLTQREGLDCVTAPGVDINVCVHCTFILFRCSIYYCHWVPVLEEALAFLESNRKSIRKSLERERNQCFFNLVCL